MFFENAARSPWILLPGLSIDRVWPDFLHVVDLSLAPEAAASATHLWISGLGVQLNLESLEFLGLTVRT